MNVTSPLVAVRSLPTLSAVLGGLSLALAAFGQTPAAPEPVVKLPDLNVTDSPVLPEPEAWRCTKLDDFDVLSNARDIATKRMLADFYKFQRGMQLVWPTPPPPLATASLILCNKPETFAAFVPKDAGREGVGTVSLFLRNREQAVILIDLSADNIKLQDGDTMAFTNADVVNYSVDHFRQVYREYVHFLLSRSETRLPAWLEEGVSQIVMDIDLFNRTLIYGKIDSTKGAPTGIPDNSDPTDSSVDSTSNVGEQPFNIALLHHKLMPMDQFLAVTPDSPEAKNPLGNNLWAKQAYAFVHFCLFGENLRYKDALVLYVQQTAHEPATEEVFKKCFKIGYAEMGKQLRGYILHTRHKYQKYTLQPADKLDSAAIELTDASNATVGLVKGDALRLAGKPEAAAAEYRPAYVRGSRDPALLAAYGETEIAVGNRDRGRQLLEAATLAGVNRPSAYVELARFRFADHRAAARGPNGRLDSEQVASVLSPLFNARKYQPPLPETYQLIAETWSVSAVKPTAGNLAVLDEGIRRFPRQSQLLYQSAQLYQQIGDTAHAASIAKLGIRLPADAAAKTQFEQLLASLPPSATAPAHN